MKNRSTTRRRISAAAFETLEQRRLLAATPVMPDATFGNNGTADFSFTGGNFAAATDLLVVGNSIYALGGAADADATIPQIVAPGGPFQLRPPTVATTQVAKLTPAGTLDLSFGGGDGIASASDFLPLSSFSDYQPIPGSSRFFASRLIDAFGPNPSFEVRRFNEDLTLDTSYSAIQVPLSLDLSSALIDTGIDYDVASNGSIVIGRFSTTSGSTLANIVRYNAAGTATTSKVIHDSSVESIINGSQSSIIYDLTDFREVGALDDGGAFLSYVHESGSPQTPRNHYDPGAGVVRLSGTGLAVTAAGGEVRNNFSQGNNPSYLGFYSHPDGRYVLLEDESDGDIDSGFKLDHFEAGPNTAFFGEAELLDVVFPQDGGIVELRRVPTESNSAAVSTIQGEFTSIDQIRAYPSEGWLPSGLMQTIRNLAPQSDDTFNIGNDIALDNAGNILAGGSVIDVDRQRGADGGGGDILSGFNASAAVFRFSSADVPVSDLTINVAGTGRTFDAADFVAVPTQDAGTVSIAGGGNAVTLNGNAWKNLPLNYTVTADTVLTFDVTTSSPEGEIIALGFDNNLTFNDANRVFQVAGTQNFGQSYVIADQTPGTTASYTVRVGDFYTGQMNWLSFVNDADSISGTSATFANISIAEDVPDAPAFQQVDGLVTIEAADETGGTATSAGPQWADFNDASAVNGRAVRALPNTGFNSGESLTGDRLDYAINFTQTGTHYVWLRMAGDGFRDDSVHVGLDGDVATLGGFGMAPPPNAGPDYQWVNAPNELGRRVTVNVTTPGLHTLNVWVREDGVRVDEIRVAKSASYDPSTPIVPNVPPTVGSLTVSSSTVAADGTVTLTANNVSDSDGTIRSVVFSVVESDRVVGFVLAEDFDGTNGFSTTVDLDDLVIKGPTMTVNVLQPGDVVTFRAFAVDDDFAQSQSVSATVTIADAPQGDTFQQVNGLVTIEAADETGGTATSQGPQWSDFNDASAVGGKAVRALPNSGFNSGDTTTGDRHDYAINFNQTGIHYVWVRLAGDTNRDDSVHVGLDGTPASFGNYGIAPNQANGTYIWADGSDGLGGNLGRRVTVNVPSAGVHTLNLWVREDGVRVDEIRVAKSSTYNPSTPPPPMPTAFQQVNGLVTIEAADETGAATGQGPAWSDFTDATAVGGRAVQAVPSTGFNAGDTTAGSRLDYRINFSQTGTHYVWLRLAGDTNRDDSVHVGLNGTAASFGNYGIAPRQVDGDYYWADGSDGFGGNLGRRVTVNVTTPGVQTLNLWVREDGVRVDEIRVAKSASYTPVGEPVPVSVNFDNAPVGSFSELVHDGLRFRVINGNSEFVTDGSWDAFDDGRPYQRIKSIGLPGHFSGDIEITSADGSPFSVRSVSVEGAVERRYSNGPIVGSVGLDAVFADGSTGSAGASEKTAGVGGVGAGSDYSVNRIDWTGLSSMIMTFSNNAPYGISLTNVLYQVGDELPALARPEGAVEVTFDDVPLGPHRSIDLEVEGVDYYLQIHPLVDMLVVEHPDGRRSIQQSTASSIIRLYRRDGAPINWHSYIETFSTPFSAPDDARTILFTTVNSFGPTDVVYFNSLQYTSYKPELYGFVLLGQ